MTALHHLWNSRTMWPGVQRLACGERPAVETLAMFPMIKKWVPKWTKVNRNNVLGLQDYFSLVKNKWRSLSDVLVSRVWKTGCERWSLRREGRFARVHGIPEFYRIRLEQFASIYSKRGKVMHNLNLFLPDVHTTKTETIDFQLRKISLSLLSHLEVRPDRERTMAWRSFSCFKVVSCLA